MRSGTHGHDRSGAASAGGRSTFRSKAARRFQAGVKQSSCSVLLFNMTLQNTMRP
jgi:hypothetical protein